MTRIIAVLAFACSISPAGCQTSQTSATGWGQIPAGVGAVIGETKIDPQIATVSTRISRYCAGVQTAASAVDVLASAKL